MLGLCLILMSAGLLLGGGTRVGLVGDLILQILAIPLVIACLRAWMAGRDVRASRLEIALAALGPLIAVVQLIPLPPHLWMALPLADLRLSPFEAAGLAPDWRPLSLTPEATALTPLTLMPAIALFFGIRQLHRAQRRVVLLATLGIVGVGAFFGFAQLAGGPQSPLRFYAVTNPDEAVGFFANRNHFAASLYVAMMLTSAFLLEGGLGFLERRRRHETGSANLIVFLGAATLVFLIGVAIILARSRAGAALALVGWAAIGFLLLTRPNNRWPKISLAVFFGVVAFAGLFVAQSDWSRLFDRLSLGTGEDARVVIARNTLKAVELVFPYGSGLGSFQEVYALVEGTADLMGAIYVNAAHNDWLQIWLEAGLPGLVGLLLFVLWVLLRLRALYLTPSGSAGQLDVTIRRAALFALILLALHSFVDYPLRTSAGMMLFALCAALAGTRSRRSRTAGAAAEPQVLPP